MINVNTQITIRIENEHGPLALPVSVWEPVGRLAAALLRTEYERVAILAGSSVEKGWTFATMPETPKENE